MSDFRNRGSMFNVGQGSFARPIEESVSLLCYCPLSSHTPCITIIDAHERMCSAKSQMVSKLTIAYFFVYVCMCNTKCMFWTRCQSYTNTRSRPALQRVETPSVRPRPTDIEMDDGNRSTPSRVKKTKTRSKTRSKARTSGSASTSRVGQTGSAGERSIATGKSLINASVVDNLILPTDPTASLHTPASPGNSQQPSNQNDDLSLEPDLKDVLAELDAVEQRVSAILASVQKEGNEVISFALHSIMQGFADAVDASRADLPTIQRTRNFTRTAETHLRSLADLRGP